jgi:YebC/PmpR family DNA-binding regulatory protein
MAGHSKWKNIRIRKGKQDALRGNTFTKLAREITVAAKAGGGDPGMNPRLRVAVEKAKAASLPKDNIERAIKKGTGELEGGNYEEIVYEGYAPHGVAILVETSTDNINRTVANVRSYFTKFNGSLGTSGSLNFVFERKAVFRISAEGLNPDEMELEFIDYGAEEIELDENEIVIYTAFEEFGSMQKVLEEKGINIISSELQRFPLSTVEVTDEQRAEIDKLIDKMDEDDDVNEVYHNMA